MCNYIFKWYIVPEWKDFFSQILIIGNESQLPYMRPPLSKEMWFDPDSEKKDALTFKQWNGSEKRYAFFGFFPLYLMLFLLK